MAAPPLLLELGWPPAHACEHSTALPVVSDISALRIEVKAQATRSAAAEQACARVG